MHNWHFDVIQYEYATALKIVEQEHQSQCDWLEKNGYSQIKAKLKAEKAVYDFLRFRVQQLIDGKLSAAETARLNNPSEDVT